MATPGSAIVPGGSRSAPGRDPGGHRGDANYHGLRENYPVPAQVIFVAFHGIHPSEASVPGRHVEATCEKNNFINNDLFCVQILRPTVLYK